MSSEGQPSLDNIYRLLVELQNRVSDIQKDMTIVKQEVQTMHLDLANHTMKTGQR